MFRSLRLGAAALAAGVCFALPASAAGATTVTLTGEILTAAPFASPNTVDCATSPGGTSTVGYHATGNATGPYPGTFDEIGTVTFHDGSVDSVSIDFTILSGATTITGHKTLEPGQSTATCGPEPGFVMVAQLAFNERYTASVTGPVTFTESGRGNTTFRSQEFPNGERPMSMEQDFQSGGPPGTTIELTPPTATNPVGTFHTVTALVRDATGQPVQGMTVLFTVTPGGGSRCGATDANGVCSLTYRGPDFPQADEITACADTNVSGASEPGEPCAVATKIWTAPATTTGQVMGGGFIKGAGASFGVGANAATFTDPVKGHCNVNDHVLHIHIRCLEVTTLILAGTHATLFGTALQDGIATNYRIDVEDLSDTGVPDTFEIQTDLLYFNGGPLTGGNIQVRP